MKHKLFFFFVIYEKKGQLKCKMRLAKDIIGVDKLSCNVKYHNIIYTIRIHTSYIHAGNNVILTKKKISRGEHKNIVI